MKRRIALRFLCIVTIICLCSGCKRISFQYGDRFDDYYARTREEDKEESGMAEDLAVLSKAEDKAFDKIAYKSSSGNSTLYGIK